MNSYKSFIQKKSKKYILEYLISEGILTYGDDFQSKLKNISKNTVASSLISIMGDEFDDRDLKQNFISTTDKEDKVSFIPQSKINFYKDKVAINVVGVKVLVKKSVMNVTMITK